MLSQTGIFTFVSVAALALIGFPANSQTLQQGTQDAYIQGNENEINQTINQYYFKNPGKGAINRKEHTTEPNKSDQSSVNNNKRQQNSNNSEWGQAQGEQRRSNPNSKK